MRNIEVAIQLYEIRKKIKEVNEILEKLEEDQKRVEQPKHVKGGRKDERRSL